MARTDVSTTKLAVDVDALQPAGVAVDQPNGMRIVPGVVAGSALGAKSRRVLVRVTNTSASTRVVTVRKAPQLQDPPATDLATQAIPATTGDILVALGPKYLQQDGTYWLDFVAGHTGVVAAYELPAGGG